MEQNDSDSVLDAIEYLQQGWQPIPVPRGAKSQNVRGWQQWRYTEEQIKNAFEDKNIGVMLGRVSNNLVDIDLDDPISYIIANELMPDTLVFGRRGKPMSHRLYRVTDWTFNSKTYKDPITKNMLVEIRCDGSMSIFPGSLHESGELVAWSEGLRAITPTEITKEQLFNYVHLVASATLFAKYWAKGSRHETTLHLAGWMIRNKFGAEELYSFIHAITSAADDEQQRERLTAVNNTIRQFEDGENVSGYPHLREYIDERVLRAVSKWLHLSERTVEEIASVNITDEGNADRLIRLFNNEFRYCAERKGFYVWNSRFWEYDIRLRMNRLAADTARSIYDEASIAATQAERADLAAWATQSNNLPRLEAMVKRVMGRSEVTVSVDEFDSHRDLFGTANGIYDLENDSFMEHSREFMMTKLAPVIYDPNAPTPYLILMAEQAIDDKDTMRTLQKGFGLALSGRTDKAIFFCYGPTDTGKTTLLTLGLQKMLGPYAKQVSLETIVAGRERSKEMYIADIHAVRYALASEPPRNFALDTAAIKGLTGDTTQKARALYEMPYDSVPTATFFMDTNYRPDIPESDDTIWNRIYLIYFKNKVKRIKGEPGFIPDFKDKIVEPIELSGLLNWCIEGYRMWREEGLFQSSGMLDVKQEYREEQDTVLQFINDCISNDENAYIPMNDLYKAYESWCRIQGIETINGKQSRNSLSDVLDGSHNWTKKVIRGANGKSVRVWTGVQFKITPPENSMYREDDEQTFKPYSE